MLKESLEFVYEKTLNETVAHFESLCPNLNLPHDAWVDFVLLSSRVNNVKNEQDVEKILRFAKHVNSGGAKMRDGRLCFDFSKRDAIADAEIVGVNSSLTPSNAGYEICVEVRTSTYETHEVVDALGRTKSKFDKVVAVNVCNFDKSGVQTGQTIFVGRNGVPTSKTTMERVDGIRVKTTVEKGNPAADEPLKISSTTKFLSAEAGVRTLYQNVGEKCTKEMPDQNDLNRAMANLNPDARRFVEAYMTDEALAVLYRTRLEESEFAMPPSKMEDDTETNI